MKCNLLIAIALLILLFCVFTASLTGQAKAQSPRAVPYASLLSPSFSVSPPEYRASTVGEVFNMNVMINDLDGSLCAVGFEVKLGYDPSLLEVLSVVEGSWLQPFGAPPNAGTYFWFETGIDPSTMQNCVHFIDLVLPDINSTWHEPFPSGSGILAVITFNATVPARIPDRLTSPLHFFNTLIANTTSGLVDQGPPQDGLYILPCTHSVAVTNVVPGKNVVGSGYCVNITSTLADFGCYAETVNITLYANDTCIGSQNVTILSESFADVIFAWNTTGFAKDTYLIIAYAFPVPDETNTADNLYWGGEIKIVTPGDIKGDGVVDIFDALLVSSSFNSVPGQPAWNANADINGDNIVDIYDAMLLAKHYQG